MSNRIAAYLRPFRDKLKSFQLRLWMNFFRTLAAEAERPLILLAPKIAWGIFRGFNFRDFSRYRVLALTWRQMATYHSTFDNVRLIGRLNVEANLRILRDKSILLKRFSQWSGREHLDLREASLEDFISFMQRHPVRVAKPLDLARGSGVTVLDDPYSMEELRTLHQSLVDRRLCVIEEFLEQHAELNRVYPQAVNTMRLTTLLTGTEARLVLPATIRFGSGGGRIDFVGAIVAQVDRENEGQLRYAMRSEGEKLRCHPDTGVEFSTVRVPFLAEAEALVLAAAQAMPELRYIGWDVAITPRGPVLIEGNGAPDPGDIQQVLDRYARQGCRRWLKNLR